MDIALSAKLEINRLGKVEHASIEMAPLLILVGKNNTGKSYVATLIWALSNLGSLLSTEKAVETRPQWFNDFAKKAISDKHEVSIEVSPLMAQEAIAHLNQMIKSDGQDFLSKTFSFSSFEESTIRLLPNDEREPISVTSGPDESQPGRYVRYLIKQGSDTFTRRYLSLARFNREGRINRLYGDLLGAALFGGDWNKFRLPIYIPAARTGLMLAYRALVSQSLDPENDQAAPLLPRPLTSFLQELTAPKRRSSANQDILRWIYDEVIDGSIEATDESEVPEFVYKPAGSSLVLPLHAASSMITELAPFVLALQNSGTRHLIFEEPEAHLHLSAQRAMARVIARLLTKGVAITLTTHSDTFIQQINNLMLLHSSPKQQQLMAEFGYEAEELVDPLNVRAYEFCEAHGRTVVKELPNGLNGFVVESLNETLASLADQTLELNEDI
jgi:hypothetical protein